MIEEHVESPGQEEMYVVIDGSVRFEVDNDSFELQRGEALFVPRPEARRSGVALTAGTTVLAIGGWPGAAYHSLPWEPIYLARHAASLGDWKRAADILEAETGPNRDSAFVRYHLARAKSRLGDDEAALSELGKRPSAIGSCSIARIPTRPSPGCANTLIGPAEQGRLGLPAEAVSSTPHQSWSAQ